MNEYFEPLSICVQKLCDARKNQSKFLDRLTENNRKFIIDKLYVFDSEKILNNKDLLYNNEYIKNKSLFHSKILDIIMERNTLIIDLFEQVLGIN